MGGIDDGLTWAAFLKWLSVNQIGDLSGLIGILISLIGFIVTVIGVRKSKNAAQRAEEAATATRESLRMLDVVVDFSSAISILEEIKRSHRQEQWPILPDRYAAIRKVLISIKSSGVLITEEQQTIIQKSLVNLRQIERTVEVALQSASNPKPAKLNAIVSDEIDDLVAVLMQIKSRTGVVL